MGRKYLKAINFDLSVHELEKYYYTFRSCCWPAVSFREQAVNN